jgi:hypothetical protein
MAEAINASDELYPIAVLIDELKVPLARPLLSISAFVRAFLAA